MQRTDRNHSCFEGDENQNLIMMKDILMTYNMFNFDLGYVQGMSDLLSPIMVIMENEVDSFWCFSGYMDKIVIISLLKYNFIYHKMTTTFTFNFQ